MLRHECPPDYRSGPHWDLMLERDGALCTWELQTLPRAWSRALGQAQGDSDRVPAKSLADHRLDYLEYEGEVSGDRGSVRRVAEGTFEWSECSDARCGWVFVEGSFEGTAEVDVKNGQLHVTG